MSMSCKLLTVGLGVSLLATGAGLLVGRHVSDGMDVQPEVVEEREQVFVCTDKYGTSQERFGVSSYERADQMWAITFADGQVGRYLQMHGEWCYILPVEEVKEEK